MAGHTLVIGIDLGTTYSCVGVWRNGRVDIVPNDQGNRTTPSCVAFTDAERLIGEGANNQVATNASNTIFDVKRLMGRSFSDPSVKGNSKYWPFEVISDAHGHDKPLITVTYLGEKKEFCPEEISAMVLVKMKETAEAYVGPGTVIKHAVVTVPAYFNNSQRKATMDAGEIAGLHTLIINEPSAAAIAYSLYTNRRDDEEYTVLVYDFGGGTLGVSLVVIKNGVLQVKATAGDTHLGGEDFTNNMVDYFVEEFKNKNQRDISGDKKALGRLWRSCEDAKRRLSTNPRIPVEVDALFEGIDFHSTITREQFEKLNHDLFLRCIEPIDKCLVEANMDNNKVDDVLLVGGCTRIPRVHKLVQDFFNGKELCRNINADEAVAYGATVHAACLSRQSHVPQVMEITPFSQGIGMLEGLICVVIPRNTNLPIERVIEITATENHKSSKEITVYEGESAMPKKFILSGIAMPPKGVPKIMVRFHIDTQGILHISAQDKESGHKITINDMGRCNDEITRMKQDALKYKAQDEDHKKNAQARNDIENLLFRVRNNMKKLEVSAATLLLKPKAARKKEKETPQDPASRWKGLRATITKMKMIQANNDSIKKLPDRIKQLQETANLTTNWLIENKQLTTSDIIDKQKQIEAVYHNISSQIENATP